MVFLSDLLLQLEIEVEDYNHLLMKKASEVEHYVERSFPVITELYSTSPQKAYAKCQEAIKDIPKHTFQEIQTFTSQVLSGEFLNEMFSSQEEERQYFDEELHNIIATLRVFIINMHANNRYQTSINQLVLDVEHGDDKSLFLAVKIEPLVEIVPAISKRISYAHTIGDHRFIEQLNKSRTASRDDKRRRNDRLNYFLMLFQRIGILEQLSQPQIAEIFINRLDVYDRDDSSLFKYIGRWKKNINRLDLRQKNQLQRSKT